MRNCWQAIWKKHGEFSKKRTGERVEIIRVSSPDHEFINSFLTILIKTYNIQVFYEMIIFSCISLFSMQRGLFPLY